MPSIRTWFPSVALAIISFAICGPSRAAPCGGEFNTWLAEFKREAATQDISQRAIASALDSVVDDPVTLTRDRSQRVFTQTFEQFSGRMISPDRLRKGPALLAQHAATFARIDRQFGVPPPVLTAIWGLETDFGVNQGKFSIIRSVATLAHDCRRPDKFRGELFDVLRIVDRGDMSPADMHGAWAGEIGQTQFLPSSYLKYAVGRDLIHNPTNALASTANYLKGYGWQRGQPWGEGTANFQVLLQWNSSQVYTKTVAYFAQQLDRE